MKILIVSDTHRRNENYFQVIEQLGKLDLVIHCGDTEGSERVARRLLSWEIMTSFPSCRGRLRRQSENTKSGSHTVIIITYP